MINVVALCNLQSKVDENKVGAFYLHWDVTNQDLSPYNVYIWYLNDVLMFWNLPKLENKEKL